MKCVRNEGVARFSDNETSSAVRSFYQRDFVIISLTENSDPDLLVSRALHVLTNLSLENPYTPILYRGSNQGRFSSVPGFNDVGGQAMGNAHPSFSAEGALDLHIDGTLEPIGEIATAMLLCLQNAASGGETLIIRTAAAIETLWQACGAHERAKLSALFDARALRRWETVNGGREFCDGPVFAAAGAGQFLGRYCVSPRDEWRYDAVDGLAGARARLDEWLQEAGEIVEIALAPGELLLMNNRRVSHGRNEFTSPPNKPRHLLRGLYLESPIDRKAG